MLACEKQTPKSHGPHERISSHSQRKGRLSTSREPRVGVEAADSMEDSRDEHRRHGIGRLGVIIVCGNGSIGC